MLSLHAQILSKCFHLDIVVDAKASESHQVDQRQDDVDDEDRPPVPLGQDPAHNAQRSIVS